MLLSPRLKAIGPGRLALALLLGAATAYGTSIYFTTRAKWFENHGFWSRTAPADISLAKGLSGVEAQLSVTKGVTRVEVHAWSNDKRAEFLDRAAIFTRREHDDSDGQASLHLSPLYTRLVSPWEFGSSWKSDELVPDRPEQLVFAGWPWHVTWCRVGAWRQPSGFTGTCYVPGRAGWVIPPSAARLDTIVPLSPLWWRLLGAAVFYGAPWYAVLSIPRAVIGARRAWRRSQQRCERCAYRLAGLPQNAACPECGEPRR